MSNKQAILKSRPHGLVTTDNIEIQTNSIPTPADGEILVKVDCVSIDPAMRGWMAEGKSYIAPVKVGEVMRAGAAGIVEASNHPNFQVGDAVTGNFGVQEYAVSKGEHAVKVDLGQAPIERWIGGLGMPGMTAYFGLLKEADPQADETVVVNAASGAVGSIVGQLAKIKGARAVGIAGGAEKCAYVVETLGFDACIDYKSGNLFQQLREACPNGIDVLFENVGGEMFDTELALMNTFGRVIVCGLISAYNATEMPAGLQNVRSILVNRLMVKGIIVFDYINDYPQAVQEMGQWHSQGKLYMREDVRDAGVDGFVDTLNLLYNGGNFGKLVLKI